MDRKHSIAIIVISVTLLGYSVFQTQRVLVKPHQKVILFDQLSSIETASNFPEEIGKRTESMGCKFEYYNESSATLERLGRPPFGRIVILRVHSGVFEEDVWLFSGENYSESRYVMEQLKGVVHMARCSSISKTVFAFSEVYVQENWQGMKDSIVFLMGCEGLSDTGLAEVMVECGAVGVVGWDRDISVDVSDRVFLDLLDRMIKGMVLSEAIESINGELDEGRLCFYPKSLGVYTLPG